MDKRAQKRHKREVSRGKTHVKLSEPDERTPEQIRAARKASRPVGGWRGGPHADYAKLPGQSQTGPIAPSPTKDDG